MSVLINKPFIPSMWSDEILKAFKKSTIFGRHRTEAHQAVFEAMVGQAIKEGIVPEDFEVLNFDVDIQHSIEHLQNKVSIAWGPDNARVGINFWVDDKLNPAGIGQVAKDFMDQVKIRGELYFFKLYAHFPKRIEKVDIDRTGNVTVTFKNRRTVETHESLLDDKEFLAKCVMINDL